MHNQKETGCCPKFNPENWDEKEINWQDKLFIKDSIKSFLHIPLNFGSIIKRNIEKIESSGAKNLENLMLSDEKSLWGSDIYFAIDKEVPNTKTEKLSGIFLTKVFEGPYFNAGKWAKQMSTNIESKGRKIKKLYFWYTTCPKCAKVYGKNYTVLFAQI